MFELLGFSFSAVSLPSAFSGQFLGSAITVFDETGCDAMFASVTSGKIVVCSDRYVWTSYIPAKFSYPMVKMDAQPFLV
jgi:hypothetical protein